MSRLIAAVVCLLFAAGCAQHELVTVARPDPLPKAPEPALLKAPQPAASINIIPRSNWAQAGPIQSSINPMGRIHRLTVHHEGMPFYETDWAQTVFRIRGIQKAHFHNRWADIGYHYIIDCKGRIWEGRLLKYQGAHVQDNNEGNIGVVLLGDFTVQQPSAAQKDSLKKLLAHLQSAYNIPKSRWFTHRELVRTECPGENLQKYVNQLRK